RFFVDERVFPQTIDVLTTRAIPVGIDLQIGKIEDLDLTDENLFGVLLQYPDANGRIYDPSDFMAAAKEQNVFVAVAADLLSLTLITPPGEMGADVVVGTTQRFGI